MKMRLLLSANKKSNKKKKEMFLFAQNNIPMFLIIKNIFPVTL